MFRQAVWEECRSSISPLLQLGAGSARQELHSLASHLNRTQSRGVGFSALVISTVNEAV